MSKYSIRKHKTSLTIVLNQTVQFTHFPQKRVKWPLVLWLFCWVPVMGILQLPFRSQVLLRRRKGSLPSSQPRCLHKGEGFRRRLTKLIQKKRINNCVLQFTEIRLVVADSLRYSPPLGLHWTLTSCSAPVIGQCRSKIIVEELSFLHNNYMIVAQ